jgi:hypothetical protein
MLTMPGAGVDALVRLKKDLDAAARVTNAPAGTSTSGHGQTEAPQAGQATPDPGHTSAGCASGWHLAPAPDAVDPV